jgi:RimJ/RimL family protein N-acetyltransferase
MSCVLREVTEADLEVLRCHRNRDDTRCWLGSDVTISEADQRRWWQSGGASPIRIAVVDGVDVGMARVDIDEERAQACVGSDVFAEHRGKRLGHDVFRAACLHAAAAGAKMLWLQVFIENTPAVKIYLKAGFVFHPGHHVTPIWRMIPGRSYPIELHYAHMRRFNS